jgi:hypothetical protein
MGELGDFTDSKGHFMETIGIMLYGYGREQADKIRASFAETLGREVTLIGASGREYDAVDRIIEGEDEGAFEEKETRVLMFLGFSQEEMSLAIDRFPRDADISRPIFCGLTESNCRWKLDHLLEHLREEHARWTGKNRKSADK